MKPTNTSCTYSRRCYTFVIEFSTCFFNRTCNSFCLACSIALIQCGCRFFTDISLDTIPACIIWTSNINLYRIILFFKCRASERDTIHHSMWMFMDATEALFVVIILNFMIISMQDQSHILIHHQTVNPTTWNISNMQTMHSRSLSDLQ